MQLYALPCLLYVISLICLNMPETRAQTPQPKALIFSYVAPGEYVHASIPIAIQAIATNGSTNNPPIMFDNTDDPSQFTDSNLAQYDALIFLMNVGEVLDAAGKQSLQNYLNKGGNFVAIHSASDCLRNTAFYGKEVGAFFDYHPALQDGTVVVLVNDNPSTSMLPQRWPLQDEFYNFKSDPRAVGAQVLLTVDESSYTDTGTKMNQGTPHPICWLQDRGAGASSAAAGRSWYTSLGHLSDTWQTDLYIQHVLGGITWALLSNTTKAFNATGLVGNGVSAANSSSSSSSSHAGETTTSASGTASPGGASTSTTSPGSPSASPSSQSGLAGSIRTILAGVLVVILASALVLQ